MKEITLTKIHVGDLCNSLHDMGFLNSIFYSRPTELQIKNSLAVHDAVVYVNRNYMDVTVYFKNDEIIPLLQLL